MSIQLNFYELESPATYGLDLFQYIFYEFQKEE